MIDYIERSTVIAMLDAAQAQQSELALEEEQKAAGMVAAIDSYRQTAEILVGLADAVRELPAAPVQEEKEV